MAVLMAFTVRINGQTIGPLERADIERRAPGWTSGKAVVEVADAGTQHFVPLGDFLRMASPPAIQPPGVSPRPSPAPQPAAGLHPVRVSGQSLGSLARTDIERRSVVWRRVNAAVEVADPGTQAFVPLLKFLRTPGVVAQPAVPPAPGPVPSALPTGAAGSFDVRVNGQVVPALSRADVERRAAAWTRSGATVEVADAGASQFAPLASFLQTRAPSPAPSGLCGYCGVRPAAFTGDPSFLVPRCARCRHVHRATGALTALLQGAFLAVMIVAGAFDERFFMGVVFGLLAIGWSRLKFYGEPIPVNAWVKVVDWLRVKLLKRPSEYYRRVWKDVPLTMRNMVDLAAIAMLGFAILNIREAWVALFPVSWSFPGSVVQNGSINEAALFDFMASVDGFTYWAPPTARGYAAAFCALLGAIWLFEKAATLTLPRLWGTRPICWPRMLP